jgi:hypothetical protein
VFLGLFCPTAIVALYPTVLWSQADTSRVSISGRIVDPMHQPIEGAEVRLVGTTFTTFSTREGTFRLLAPRSKEMLVHFRRPGFRAQLIKLAEHWNGVVMLEPGRYELPEISVTARYAKPAVYAATYKYDEVFRRVRIGLGQLITRQEVDRRGAVEVGQLLEGKAGVKVSMDPQAAGTMVYFARCNERPPRINVYLDGRKLHPPISTPERFSDLKQTTGSARSPIGEMLDQVSVLDIEMIEIFRGPGELPAEYNDGNCGAIAIWTRQGVR